MASKGNRVFVRRKYNLPLAKTMRTNTKLGDGGPYVNMFFASVSYTSDLAPFQGASPGWRFPGLKPWAESCGPSGAINRPNPPGFVRLGSANFLKNSPKNDDPWLWEPLLSEPAKTEVETLELVP